MFKCNCRRDSKNYNCSKAKYIHYLIDNTKFPSIGNVCEFVVSSPTYERACFSTTFSIAIIVKFYCRKGDPFQSPRAGTRKCIVQGDTCSDKARDFIGKGCPGRQQMHKGTQKSCSATWLRASGFMIMGLVSRLSLANYSDSGSFQVAQALLSQDDWEWEFWEVVRHEMSPFDRSQVLPVFGDLLIPGPLPESPVIITQANGNRGGWPGGQFQSVCFP